MAGDWIKFRKVVPGDPRTAEIARKCRRSRASVVGALVALWCYGDDYAVEQESGDGFISYLSADDIDRIVGMEGFAVACPADWLRLEEDGAYLPNFQRHNGDTAKKRAQKTARQTRYRRGRKSVDARASTSVDAPVDAPALLEKRREEKKEESSNEDSSATTSGSSPEIGPSEFWFPTTAGTWHLPRKKLGEYQAAYSDRLDVAAELRKSRQWLIDNKPKRKTKRGMPKFLTGWLNRAYDKGGSPKSLRDPGYGEELDYNPETGEYFVRQK